MATVAPDPRSTPDAFAFEPVTNTAPGHAADRCRPGPGALDRGLQAGPADGQSDEFKRLQQQQRGHKGLRFMPALEAAFVRDKDQTGRMNRAVLLLLGLFLVAITPFLDHFFAVPEGFNRVARPLQFLVEIPAMLLALPIVLHRAWQVYSEMAVIVAAIVVAAGLYIQHVVGAYYGLHVPLLFTGLVVTTVTFLGRVRFRLLLPAVIAIAVGMVLGEWWSVAVQPGQWYMVMATGMLIGISLVGGYSLEYAQRTTWLQQSVLAMSSRQDSLTGLLNHAAAHAQIARGMQQAARANMPYALAVIDLDHFKTYNDCCGHPAGDQCLRSVAGLLRQQARRPLDCVGRLGGDEFILCWYGVDLQHSRVLVRRLNEALAALNLGHGRLPNADRITLSIGLLVLSPTHNTDAGQALGVADSLLYQAKRQGRNRSVDGDSIAMTRAA